MKRRYRVPRSALTSDSPRVPPRNLIAVATLDLIVITPAPPWTHGGIGETLFVRSSGGLQFEWGGPSYSGEFEGALAPS